MKQRVSGFAIEVTKRKETKMAVERAQELAKKAWFNCPDKDYRHERVSEKVALLSDADLQRVKIFVDKILSEQGAVQAELEALVSSGQIKIMAKPDLEYTLITEYGETTEHISSEFENLPKGHVKEIYARERPATLPQARNICMFYCKSLDDLFEIVQIGAQ